MNVLQVISTRSDALEFFSPVRALEGWTLKVSLPGKNTVDPAALVSTGYGYFQLPDTPAARKKLQESMETATGGHWGLWDPDGLCEDPALWFFAGCTDYIGPQVKKLESGRFLAMLEWTGHRPPSPETAAADFWDTIQPEAEYDFAFCLIHWGDADSVKRRLGEVKFSQAWKGWRGLLEALARERGGQLWMESGTTLLFLFPPQRDRSPVFSFALKMLISRQIHSLENLGLDFCPELKIALHKGLCTYRKPGDTGTLVSDAVNSVFHLGHKFAPADRVVFTAALLEDLPPALIPLAQPLGVYENRQIYRLPQFS